MIESCLALKVLPLIQVFIVRSHRDQLQAQCHSVFSLTAWKYI